ncbi:hypothetical protein NQ314_005160 [Rhamnusium bicolor]|uniref:MULE transposase domain-containing protein n=1 Tax=Rhamnusium bicolor TaxID=1586634 RepID=A0AAV8ZHT2_9CUCU|nr:hypothetical protein NQ314_005160 [Rhamnusium bicolor]
MLILKILNSTRESISSDLKRIDLLTNKDIRNIKMAYKINLQDGCRHSDDATSVDIWVKECEKSDCNPILFYKPQGQKLTNFEDNDFCLIIMNSVQRKILMDFGKKIITIDGTHALNAYNFELTTLLTLDENREGFTVAFMFSNRKDTTIYITFFTQIKNIVGQIHRDIFMSDITETYINAWNFIMGPVKKKIAMFMACRQSMAIKYYEDIEWRKKILNL